MSSAHLSSVLPRWATPTEYAELVGLHVESVYRQLKNGTVPGAKLGGRWFVDLDAISELFPSRHAS